MNAMLEVAEVATIVRKYYGVACCALVSEEAALLSIIALHGLSKKWEQVTSEVKGFDEKGSG